MPATDELRLTLERLIVATCRGSLADLPALANQIERQIGALESTLPSEAALRDLQALALEAATQLAAATRGVSAAHVRIAEIQAARSGAGIYGGDGQRRPLTLPSHTVRRL